MKIEGAPALDVDVAHPAHGEFRRIGRLGVSPILEVDDFKKVPALQRDAFETLCTWMTLHEADIVGPTIPPTPVLQRIDPVSSGPLYNLWSRSIWPIIAAVAGIMMVHSVFGRRYAPREKRDGRTMLGLFLSSFLLRSLLGPFGPHHVNGQGPAWIIAITSDPTRLLGYGPGYQELFWILGDLFPRHADTAIFVSNALLGAIAAPLLFVLARTLGLDHVRSSIAGAIVAIDAVAIRYGATEAYFPSIVTLTLGAAVCFVLSTAHARTHRFFRSIALASLGVLLSVQAVRIHPIAWGPVALGPAFVLAFPVATPDSLSFWKRYLRVVVNAAAIAAFVVLAVVLTSGRVITSVAGTVDTHWNARSGLETVFLEAFEYPLITLLAAAVAMVFVKPRGLFVPASLSLVALFATRGVYNQSAVWIASYDRIWLAAPIMMFSSMIPDIWVRHRRAWAVVGVALSAVFFSRWSTMTERTTEQLEYAFFRQAFAALPPGCRVAHVPRVDRRIVLLPEYAIGGSAAGPRAVVGVSSTDEVRNLMQPGTCVRYARTSLCTSADGRAVCNAVEEGLKLERVTEMDLPAKPSHITSTYDRDVVHVGLFEVQDSSAAR